MSAPLLAIRDLVKVYGAPGAPGGGVRALDGVSLRLDSGEMVALVGESGSGKSTLLAVAAALEPATAGRVELEGRDLATCSRSELRALRRRVQVVFQDPYESLDPRQTIGDIVAEPLVVHGLGGAPDERTARVRELLAEVGLEPPEFFLARRPAELSGGQRQRVAIASALATGPALLLADEPVSMLDVSVRAEILNLLARLRRTHRIAVLLVTHDLATAAAVAERVAVMYLGRIVEEGPTRAVLAAPAHPYTRALVAANPAADPSRRRARDETLPRAERADAAALPSGCRFHPRCPRAAERCRADEPALRPLAPGRAAACHFAEEVARG